MERLLHAVPTLGEFMPIPDLARVVCALGSLPPTLLTLLKVALPTWDDEETWCAFFSSTQGRFDSLFHFKRRCARSPYAFTKTIVMVGDMLCLRRAHENGCAWNEWTCARAAENGHLDCLRYLHENGCPWNEDTCLKAARRGHLACLRYAHENGCPWYEWVCENAARHGHLDCLRYAHENGCPWDVETYCAAALSGHLGCLKYVHAHGCP